MPTIGDIRESDLKNGEYLRDKGIKRHFFMTLEDYTEFQTEFLKTHLERMGIGRDELEDTEHTINRLEQKGIRLERRKRTGEDAWRSGYYIYKDMEIAAFLSAPHETMSVLSAYECVL